MKCIDILLTFLVLLYQKSQDTRASIRCSETNEFKVYFIARRAAAVYVVVVNGDDWIHLQTYFQIRFQK